jgi:8-oxo-dGTP diphosphatase
MSINAKLFRIIVSHYRNFPYNTNMTRALIPSGAHIIFLHGSHILLLKRSSRVPNWPWHWCFPGGKVDENELLREAAIRETLEEVGVFIDGSTIYEEVILNARYSNGTRIYYFWVTREWIGQPENLEKALHDEFAWFDLEDLPENLVPHHREALSAYRRGSSYAEFDTLNSK